MQTSRLVLLSLLVCLPAVAAKRMASDTTRTITVVNQCRARIIAGMVGGAASPTCDSGSCSSGSRCNAKNNICYWTLPLPTGGGKALPGSRVVLAPKASATYKLTNAPNSNGVKLSGTFYAETGCDAKGENCQTAPCPGCGPGVGVQGPATIAEFTFLAFGPDAYDISMINGINVPVTMTPASVTTQAGNAYFCQAAGSLTASSTGLPACSWNFTSPPNLSLAFVASGGTSPCSASGCPAGQVCGQSADLSTNTVTQSCGKQIGWWTANQLCVNGNDTFGSPINCAAPVTSGGTMSQLLGCSGPYATASCYSTGAATTCCGCPSWSYPGLVPSSACQSTNPQWTSLALPWATFVKNGCPTAYSFQYDDPTSSFTCNTPGAGPGIANTMGYTITFCPGGKEAF